jgi:hypothetical protein
MRERVASASGLDLGAASDSQRLKLDPASVTSSPSLKVRCLNKERTEFLNNIYLLEDVVLQ